MIRSFKDKRTEAVASGKILKGFPSDLDPFRLSAN